VTNESRVGHRPKKTVQAGIIVRVHLLKDLILCGREYKIPSAVRGSYLYSSDNLIYECV
jgi:hypothetical protein